MPKFTRPTFDAREAKGSALAHEFGMVRRVDDFTYKVRSQRLDAEYDVRKTETGWVCGCPDFRYRLGKCKHIWAVEISRSLRQTVRESVVIQPIAVSACPKCGSGSIKRAGLRHNSFGSLQKFRCKSCGYWFTVNIGFEKMRATPRMITAAMQLYFSGESLRSTQKFLALQGLKVSHVAISKWIIKYVSLMDKFASQLKPQVSDTWRADEMYVKVKGNAKWLFAMMDDETRYWIAQQMADDKFRANVRPMFAEAKRVGGKRPTTFITDGGWQFNRPFQKEFWSKVRPLSKHVRDIRLDGSVHNNKMERMNGEMRDREKVMRGIKRIDSPIFKGYQIYHNFIRPHESLDGATPAEKAGIRVEGSDKWLTLIQNASVKSVDNAASDRA